MFNFFKTKNPLSSLIIKSVTFLMLPLFVFTAVIGVVYVVTPEIVSAQIRNQAPDYTDNIDNTSGDNNPTSETQQTESSIVGNAVRGAIESAVDRFLTTIAQAYLMFAAALVGLGGLILETSIKYSIFEFGKLLIDKNSILLLWRTLRDLANMSFIFILLYASIRMILGDGGSVKTIITKVCIAALLINFSLFFTQIVIDTSNIVAITFYNEIVKTKCAVQFPSAVGELGTAFMCKMGLGSLFSSTKEFVGLMPSVSGDNIIRFISFVSFSTILLLLAAMVLLGSAFMFIIRSLKLIKALILSPVAFASIAIPIDNAVNFKGWWEDLLKNSLLAPIYMITTWAVLQLLGNIGGNNVSFAEAILGKNGSLLGGTGDLYLTFFITVFAMFGILVVADKFGGAGAGFAIKQIQNARGWAQGQIQGNLGRGLVRAAAIPNLDKKLFDNKFGKTTILGRGLRDATTGGIMKQKFGSKQSVSDVDKELKKYREEYAKEKSEKIDKDIEKGMDARKDWVAIMQDPQSTNKMKIEAQKKVNEEHKKYYENLKIAHKNAEERKSYAEAKELADKIYVAGGADKTVMEDRLKNWEMQDKRGDKIEFDVNKPGSAEAGYLKKVIDETKKVKEDSIKVAKLAAAAKVEKGDGLRLKLEKSKLGKSWKWLYGEDQRLAKDMVKKFREDAKKGQKGDAKKKLKELAKAVGIEEEDEEEKGKDGGSDKGGEAKKEGDESKK